MDLRELLNIVKTQDCSFSTTKENVVKKKIKNYVVENIQRIIFGDPKKISEMLGANSDDYIGTSYIERINLTIRTSLVRFVRKKVNFSKIMKKHTKTFDLFQAWITL